MADRVEHPHARVDAALLEHHAHPRAEARAADGPDRGRAPGPCRRSGGGSPRRPRSCSSCRRRSDRAPRSPRRRGRRTTPRRRRRGRRSAPSSDSTSTARSEPVDAHARHATIRRSTLTDAIRCTGSLCDCDRRPPAPRPTGRGARRAGPPPPAGAARSARPGSRRSTSASRLIAAKRDALRAEVNDLSKQVGQLRRTGDVAGAEAAAGRAAARWASTSGCWPTSTTDVAGRPARPAAAHPQPARTPTRPTATSEADNPVVVGPVNLAAVVRRPPAGAALGDRRGARHPRQRAGREDQRGDVHHAARARRHARPGAVPAARSTATPTRSRRSARRRWSPRPR